MSKMATYMVAQWCWLPGASPGGDVNWSVSTWPPMWRGFLTAQPLVSKRECSKKGVACGLWARIPRDPSKSYKVYDLVSKVLSCHLHQIQLVNSESQPWPGSRGRDYKKHEFQDTGLISVDSYLTHIWLIVIFVKWKSLCSPLRRSQRREFGPTRFWEWRNSYKDVKLSTLLRGTSENKDRRKKWQL